MYTIIYVNHDAIGRIRENAQQFADALFMSVIEPRRDLGRLEVAGFVPAAVVAGTAPTIPLNTIKTEERR